jgi:hypothetical protein
MTTTTDTTSRPLTDAERAELREKHCGTRAYILEDARDHLDHGWHAAEVAAMFIRSADANAIAGTWPDVAELVREAHACAERAFELTRAALAALPGEAAED